MPKTPSEMALLGRAGGMKTKATQTARDPDYYRRIGAMGGKETARHRSKAAQKIREDALARSAAAAKGGQRIRDLVAKGRAVEAILS